MRKLFILLSFFTQCCIAQDVININGADCGLHGSAKPGSRNYFLDGHKNRYDFPKKSAIDPSITLEMLLKSGDPNQFSMDKAADISGYVYNVKMGGIENCNCKTKDPNYRDTHIELTPDENQTGPESRVIVEVTPRFRLMMEDKGIDWSTSGLKKTLIGKRLEVVGWLFYDAEHELEAFANDPDDAIGRKNWRATCWEVHPITYMKIGGKAGEFYNTKSTEQVNNNNGANNNQPANGGFWNSSLLWFLVGVIVIVLYFLLKPKSGKPQRKP